MFVAHSSHKYGASRSLLALIDGLRDRGVTCRVVLPREGPFSVELTHRGIDYIVLPLKQWASRDTWVARRLFRECFNLVVSALIAIEARSWGADVIHTNSGTTPVGALAALLVGKPHVWHVREFGREDHGFSFDLGFERSARVMDRLSSRVICVSQALRSKYARQICSEKLHVIYNPIDVEAASPLLNGARTTSADTVPNQHPMLAIVGSIQPGKGQMDAVLAVTHLIQQGVEVDLRVVGDGDVDYFNELKRTVFENHIEQYVEFTGFVEDPFTLMQAADIVLVCSRSEAFGRATIESMMLKTPIIAARSGATPELITEGFNGLLYEPGDYQELARRIQYLFAHPRESAHIVRNSFEWASERFTVTRHADEVFDVLQKAVRAGQREAPCAG